MRRGDIVQWLSYSFWMSRSWCTLCVDPWSIFHTATPVVASWGCILCSDFGVTGPLGLHAVGSTLGTLLQLHCLELVIIVEDESGFQIRSLWLFSMWLAVFLSQGDHDVLHLAFILCLTCWLEFFGGFHRFSCNESTPHISSFSWRRVSANVLGFGSHSYFCFYQVRWDESCRGSLLLCLVSFDFSEFLWLGCLWARICRASLILVSLTLVVL